MKKIALIVDVPDCFEPNTNRIEITIKGIPNGKAISAEVLELNFGEDDADDRY